MQKFKVFICFLLSISVLNAKLVIDNQTSRRVRLLFDETKIESKRLEQINWDAIISNGEHNYVCDRKYNDITEIYCVIDLEGDNNYLIHFFKDFKIKGQDGYSSKIVLTKAKTTTITIKIQDNDKILLEYNTEG